MILPAAAMGLAQRNATAMLEPASRSLGRATHRCHLRRLAMQACNAEKPKSDVGLGLKGVWYGAEALGKLIGGARRDSGGGAGQQDQLDTPASSSGRLARDEAISALRRDYDVNYFVSGKGDMFAYAPNCRFADDFASFRGLDRFKTNVGNLGGMLSDVQLEVMGWEEQPDALRTQWRFNAILGLFPWRPRLAAAGSTTHRFDEATGLVVEHIEEWNVDPGRVVRALLKPSSTLPLSQWDVLFNAVHDGDCKGVWLALSAQITAVAATGVVVSLVQSLVAGEGVGPGLWAFSAVAVAGAMTELVKMTTGMGGGS